MKFEAYASQGEETPSSLYKLCAMLIKHSIVSVDDLYPFLSPDDETAKKVWDQHLKDAMVALSPLPKLHYRRLMT